MAITTDRAVVNDLISWADRRDLTVTPLQAHKLVYLAYGEILAETGQQLFEEPIEAWKFGPVVPDLYHALKRYGSGPITEPLPKRGTHIRMIDRLRPARTQDDDVAAKLHDVWNRYAHLPGEELVRLTHLPGTPWHLVWNRMGGRERLGAKIPDSLIYAFFREGVVAP